MRLSQTRRNLGILAAVVGILQGLAWAAMSLAAIILHNWSGDVDYSTDYTKLIGQLLYSHFILGADLTSEIQFIIRPSDFTIFMWIYFLISIGWFVLSADQLAAILLEKQRQTTMMVMWGVITLIVCLIDIILVCLLARDYTACGEDSSDDSGLTEVNYLCYLTIGIAMTIAARGYTVWVLNLLLSMFMFYSAANIIKETNTVESLYAAHRIPRVTLPKSGNDKFFTRDGKVSPNFSKSSNDATIPRSEPTTPDFLGSGGTPLPSFLSRGDKFSY